MRNWLIKLLGGVTKSNHEMMIRHIDNEYHRLLFDAVDSHDCRAFLERLHRVKCCSLSSETALNEALNIQLELKRTLKHEKEKVKRHYEQEIKNKKEKKSENGGEPKESIQRESKRSS